MNKENFSAFDLYPHYKRISKNTFKIIVIFLFVAFISIFFVRDRYVSSHLLLIYLLLYPVIMVPLCICRLHDIGKSGYFMFLAFIPIVLLIIVVYLCFPESTTEINKYTKSEDDDNTTEKSSPIEPKIDNFNRVDLDNINNSSKYNYTYDTTYNTTNKVDINSASFKELSKLHGVGYLQAKKIVKHRKKIGYYYDINELATDLELYHKTLEVLRDKITFSRPTIHDNKDYNR